MIYISIYGGMLISWENVAPDGIRACNFQSRSPVLYLWTTAPTISLLIVFIAADVIFKTPVV